MTTDRGGLRLVSATAGLGIGGAFAVLFTALKLTGQLDWSWWLVLAPMWAPAAVAAVVVLGLGGLYLTVLVAERRWHRTRRRTEDDPGPGRHGPVHRWGRRL